MFAGARQATASTSTLKGAPEVTRHASRKFPHRLNFYTAPPLEEITLEDFETWAIDRLRGASARPRVGHADQQSSLTSRPARRATAPTTRSRR